MLNTIIRTLARPTRTTVAVVSALAASALLCTTPARTLAGDTLLNVSYDPTRELYRT